MRSSLLLAALCLFGVACSAQNDASTGNADSDITSGEIVAGNSPYYWANLSYEDHVRATGTLGYPGPTNLASDDDPLRVRLQTWADRFDAALRKTTRNRVAPHPVVKLLKSAQTMNAWSEGTVARLGVPFGDPSATGSTPVSLLGLFAANPLSTADLAGYESMLVQPPEWKRLQSFTQIWDMAAGECTFSAAGDRLTPREGCSLAGFAAPDVATVATSPFVTVSTDLVAMLDEKAMAFVMAHELGHLYRAHSSPLTARKYDFWYEQGADVPRRPVPSSESAELQRIYAQLVRQDGPLERVTGVHFAPQARFTVASLASFGVFGDCSAVLGWSSSHSAYDLVARAQTGAVADARLAEDYRTLEAAVLQCQDGATFVDETQSPLVPGVLGAAAIGGQLRYGGRTPESAYPRAGETVRGYLDRLNDVARDLAREQEAFVARVREEGIGLYTTEQEADEVALELLARVGIGADDALAGWLQFMGAFDALQGSALTPLSTETGDATAAQCGAWLKDDFTTTDERGARVPILMTLGSLEDTHHGSCYRLYNLWRESRAHRGGRETQVAAPEPLSPPWEELVEHARALRDQAAGQGL